jgi:RNA polymerase sigma-70 factor (ECF subfamily)
VSVPGSKRSRFESSVAPHLDAAYNLARWLTRNEHDAEDVFQEAMLRAFSFFDGFRGVNTRAWVLKIVRNTCFTWLEANRPNEIARSMLDELDGSLPPLYHSGVVEDPEILALRRTTAAELDSALCAIANHYREVVVLREIEGLSYKEIATVIDAPVGTVMSRLARARVELRRILSTSRCSRGKGHDT